MHDVVLRIVRVAAYLTLTLPLMPVQAVLLAVSPGRAAGFARFYHRLCWRVLGFRVTVTGEPCGRRSTLFVANHVSYLDITILGGLIRGSFIAKAEVAGWPLFGQLARLQRTVFIERRVRDTARHRDHIADRLAAGDALILFPEGTSGDGNRVRPFRSALFGAAVGTVAVQPVSIAYVGLNGMPMGRFYRPFVAWYGAMSMAPHLWTLLGLGIVTVAVEFHPVVTLAELGSRRALAAHCHDVIAAGLSAALSGRAPGAAAPALVPPVAAPPAAVPIAGLQG